MLDSTLMTQCENGDQQRKFQSMETVCFLNDILVTQNANTVKALMREHPTCFNKRDAFSRGENYSVTCWGVHNMWSFMRGWSFMKGLLTWGLTQEAFFVRTEPFVRVYHTVTILFFYHIYRENIVTM